MKITQHKIYHWSTLLLFIQGKRPTQRVRIYLEGDVHINGEQTSETKASYVATWHSSVGSLKMDVLRSEHIDQSPDAVFRRAWRQWTIDPKVQPDFPAASVFDPAVVKAGQFDARLDQSRLSGAFGTVTDPLTFGLKVESKPTGQRRLRFSSRSQTPFNAYSFETPNTQPAVQVLVITGGVTLNIDGIEESGPVDLRADHMVVWAQAVAGFDGQAAETLIQNGDAPLQIYLEGNIVVLQNDPKQDIPTVTTAQRAFFDIREKRAILQNVEVKVKVKTPKFPISIRIRAEEVRQQSESSFQALNAWVTTSQFGKPGYRIEAANA